MTEIKMDGFVLIGIKLEKTSNEGGQSNIDCGNLWQEFEKGNYAGRIPDKTGEELYAVYYDYEGDYTKPFSYFIGAKVEANAEVPEGMNRLSIPGNHYQKIVASGKMPECIANAWMDIWNSNIQRAYQYDFEIYDVRSWDWNNAVVDIYISTQTNPLNSIPLKKRHS